MRTLRSTLLIWAPLAASGCGGSSEPQSIPRIVAHRGASYLAPENTLAAFDLAWQLDADVVEGDFFLSADGEIVCHHDDTTARTGGHDEAIGRQTLDELRSLDVGAWKGPGWAGERIPTLDEVLDAVPEGKGILLEIKSGTDIVDALVEAIATTHLAPEQIVVISFDADVIEAVKRRLPRVAAYWCVAFRQHDRVWTPTIEQIVETAQRIGADAVSLEANLAVIDRPFVDALRKAGLGFHVWTVNDVDAARRLVRLGVDSITTDRPGWLRGALDQD